MCPVPSHSCPSSWGGTNTGDGIREAIETFEDSGNSDSAKEAILLADGKTNEGPDPVEQARRAADRNITINTVAIGDNADTSELRSIADATGGDYYETDNATDLPQVFGRIGDDIENETRLNDSDGDRIPDIVEEADGLTMPAGPNAGQPIDLDPQSADTDGDGLSDGEEISINYDIVNTSSGTTVEITTTAVRANPSRVDTDGDGLTDLEERREWTISVLNSHDDAKNFPEAADKENRNAYQYLTNKTVSSSPLVSDTDADGLNDTEELLHGTDPGDPDSDNDSQTDGEEVAHGYDPTLFDITPPTVDISAAGYGSRTPSLDTLDPRKEGEPLNFYYVRGIADDQSDVQSSTIIIDGEEFSTGDESVLFTVEDPSENEGYAPVFPAELDGIVLRRGSGGLAAEKSGNHRNKYVDLLISIYRALPETPAAAYAMDPEQGFGVREGQENYPSPVTADSLEENRFHDGAWVLFIPPRMVEHYGRETLKEFPTSSLKELLPPQIAEGYVRETLNTCPARRVAELDDGTVVLVADGDPSEWTEWRKLAIAMNAPASTNRSF